MTGRCVSLPGSRSVPEPHGCLLPAVEPCRRALSPLPGRGGAFYPCLTNRLQPASDPVREGRQTAAVVPASR